MPSILDSYAQRIEDASLFFYSLYVHVNNPTSQLSNYTCFVDLASWGVGLEFTRCQTL